ncbi:CD276 protein, partial [Polypterus senegalus]
MFKDCKELSFHIVRRCSFRPDYYANTAPQNSSVNICTPGDDCLTANIGETVLIPCSLNIKEPLKAEDISVEWTAGDGLVVYSFVKGMVKDQDPKFRDRAELFKSELSRGNFSLSLSNVSEADDGERFQCIYYNNRAQDNNRKDLSKHCLQVAGSYSDPIVIRLSSASSDSEVNFTCKSAGGYPEPKVYWSVNKELFQESSQVNTSMSRDSKGRYNVTSVLTLNVTGDVSVTCIIENERLREKRISNEFQSDDCLTANIGDTVQIPCSLNTKEFLKAEDISVEWTTGDGRIIHSFVKGKDNLTNQVPQFKGRAQLFKPELSRGNLSLRLSNVSVDDEGEFECKYHKAGETSSSGVCYPCLLVAGRYSDPIVTISSSASNDSEVNFTCKSAGGYPEPKVYWSVNKMPFQDISRVNTRTSNDSKGRYNVTSILTLNVTGDVSVTCIIENERLRENRTSNEVQCEFTLYVVQKQTITSQQSHKTKPARCHHTCAICPFIIVSSLNSSWQPQTSGATNAIKVTLIWEAYMYTQKRRG